jgi:enoyl-CoA hydratase
VIVEFEIRGRVALIRLNRPEARNAVSLELAEALEAAIDRLESDDELWTGVLCANGPAFSAGADLKAIAAGTRNLGTARGGFGGLVARERTKPLIAAVEGPALAGGTELVLACDLVVASTTASFGLPEVKRSLLASAGGLVRLPRLLPRNLAMEIALTGDPLTAETAYQHGLVNQLVDPGNAVEAACGLAGRINANAPLAVRATRQAILSAQLLEDLEGIQLTVEETRRIAKTDDFQEGPRAFIEKRPPQWKGR